MIRHLAAVALTGAVVCLSAPVLAAGPGIVVDAPSCARALADAREGAATAAVSQKARTAGEELIALSETRCADGNFTAADELLAIARGIFAQE